MNALISCLSNIISKAALHKLLTSTPKHQLLYESHKKISTPLNTHFQILSKLINANLTHLCKLVEKHRLSLSAPNSSGRGAINKHNRSYDR